MERTRVGVAAVVLLLAVVFLSVPGVVGATAETPDDENESVSLQSPESATVSAEPEDGEEVQLLVDIADSPGQPSSVQELKERANETQANFLRFAERTDGITVENRLWLANTVLVTVDTSKVPIDSLAYVEGVERVGENGKVSAASTDVVAGGTNDTATPSAETLSTDASYGLHQINAPTVWNEYNTRGDGVRVAVLDTGIDTGHNDLELASSNGWAEFDGNGSWVDSNPQEYDQTTNPRFGHGTHVSGTVAGSDQNELNEYIGVAPDVELMHAAVLTDCSEECQGTTSQIIAGMEWAVGNGTDVLSLSLGGGNFYGPYIDAVRNAEANGVTVVAASGNSGDGTSVSPGDVYDALTVGASDENGDVWTSSSGEQIDTDSDWGSDAPSDWPDSYVVPDIVAPGVGVWSAQPDSTDQIVGASGTSMATPHVAGAVALVHAATSEDLSPSQVKTALRETAQKPDDWSEPEDERDTRYGRGIIDVPAAISYVQSEPNFEVTSASLSETTIAEGDSVTTTATVENNGGGQGTFTAGLRVDGSVVAIQSVTVAAGDSETVSFERTFDTAGEYDIAVNSTQAGTLTVQQPPDMEVQSASLGADTIDEGESATVEATVENTGDRDGVFTAKLELNGQQVDTTDVTVPAGGTATATFERTFDTASQYDITVNGVSAGTLTVREPVEFAVQSASLSAAEIYVNESVTVNATVENLDDRDGTFLASLAVDGGTVETEAVDIAAGATATVTFERTFGAAGEYDIAVNGTQASTLTVTEPPDVRVVDTSLASAQIDEGENATVNATITNTGGEAESYTADLQVDGQPVDTQNVTIAAGETVTVSFVRQFPTYGKYNISVNDTEAGELLVESPVNFEVQATSLDSDAVGPGETVTISATVANLDERGGTARMQIAVDFQLDGTRYLTLAENETKTVSFERTFDEPGEYEIDVTTASVGTLTVQQPAAFEVRDAILAQPTVLEGETARINATIANVGDITGTFTAGLAVDGTVVDTTDVTVAGGGTAAVNFTRTFTDSGDYEVAINDTQVGSLKIRPLVAFSVQGGQLGADSIEAGESVAVDVTAENTDSVEGVVAPTLTIDGTAVATKQLTLGAGETGTTTFTPTFDDAGTYTVQANGTNIGEVQVNRTAELRGVTVRSGGGSERTLADASVRADEVVTFNATVAPAVDWSTIDGETRTVTVALGIDGEAVATREVTVSRNGTTSVEFEWTPTWAGEYTIAVVGQEAGTLSVRSAAGTVEDYRQPDGSVPTGNLQSAIDDWLAGDVDTSVLQEVINLWLDS